MTPKRIQRKRTKGWKMPPNTVYVGRGSKWGNPFNVKKSKAGISYFRDKIGGLIWSFDDTKLIEESIRYYRNYILEKIKKRFLDITELKGKNLACWCPLNQPCHADILLELANKEEA